MEIIETKHSVFCIDNETGDIISDIDTVDSYNVISCATYVHGFPEIKDGDVLYKLENSQNRGYYLPLEKRILNFLNTKLKNDIFSVSLCYDDNKDKNIVVTYEILPKKNIYISNIMFNFSSEFFTTVNNIFSLFNKTVSYNNTGNTFWYIK